MRCLLLQGKPPAWDMRRHWRHASSPAVPQRQPLPKRRSAVQVSAWGREAPVVAVPPPAAQPPARPSPIPLVLAMAGGVLAWRWLFPGRSSTAQESAPSTGGLIPPSQVRRQPSADPEAEKEYRMALARTRQATAVHRAIGFMKAGSSTRAMVELRRALHENSICRSPLLSKAHSKGELEALYRLHVQNAEVPSDFATLLHLRSMLDLGFDEAERIEAEVMQQGAAYSI